GLLHWISVISSWVEFLAAAVGGGGIATCSRRSRLCGNRRQGARARTRNQRRDVPTSANRQGRCTRASAACCNRRCALLSFAAQRHHVPEVSCASTTRTAAGHLDA